MLTNAQETLREAIRLTTSRLGPTSNRTLSLRARYAADLFAQEQTSQGFEELGSMVSDCINDLGPTHETTLAVRNNYAMKMAEYSMPDGLRQLTELLDLVVERWGECDGRALLLRSNVAAATGMAGRYSDAISQIEHLLSDRSLLDDRLFDTLETNLKSWKALNRP